MFAVAPVDHLGKIKLVHRSQIRTRIQLDHPAVVYPESPTWVRWTCLFLPQDSIGIGRELCEGRDELQQENILISTTFHKQWIM